MSSENLVRKVKFLNFHNKYLSVFSYLNKNDVFFIYFESACHTKLDMIDENHKSATYQLFSKGQFIPPEIQLPIHKM